MNDKQIQAILAISEMGSMNRAAEKLYISQPALKKRVDTLEAELGVALLRRNSEGCSLTEAGQVFLKGIRPLYSRIEAVIEETRRMKQQVLRVCAMPDISMRVQDESMINFMHENPDVIIEQVLLPTSQWLKAIEEGRADLCRCFYDPGRPGIYKERNLLFHPIDQHSKNVCVLDARHPLAKEKCITAKHLQSQTVYAGPLLFTFSALREFAEKQGIDLRCDESAGKRYEMISRCLNGAVYIHPKGYAEDLKPLSVIRFSGFSYQSCFVYGRDNAELAARYIRFCEAQG